MQEMRGQNVSVLQQTGGERWKSPISAFNIVGGSVPRNNPSGSGRTVSDTENNSSRPLCKSSSAGAYADSRSKDLTGKSVNSSILDSANRELSPVRWCNGNVDGVYLGRSGWVHVQERPLDDGKGVVYCDNSFYTLPCLTRFPETDISLSEGRQCNRPLNLPLSPKKYAIRANYQRPSNFDRELESISPPSVTPIISPPPAFKDDGANVEFPRQSIRKPFYSEELFRAGSEGSFCSPKEKRNPLRSSPHGFSTGSSVSTLKHERLLCQTRQLTSLDDNFSNRLRRDRRVNKISFHSLDNDIRTDGSGVVEASDSESFSRNFEDPKKKISCEESDKEDDEDYEKNKNTSPNGYFFELLGSSKEELRPRNPVKSYRQRNYQRNGRRASSAHKSRSSSSDSSSSGSNKNSEKIVSSRRTNSMERHTFELDNSSSRSSKHFYVKRSRSLQLSEKRSPCDSSLNDCSGKSWDSMPPEHPALQVANQIRGGEVQFPQNLHRVLVTVNGDSIPVGTSSSQSLNKITTSEEQQKKLILEAEKEARIISEFLNGTRSREAARNLLVHRYFKRHEDVGSIELSENSAPKDVCESHFLESRRRGNFWKKNKPNSSAASLQQPPPIIYSKPLTSFFRVSNTSNRTGSLVSLQNLAEQRKKEGVEGRARRGSSSSSEQCSKGRHSKIMIENTDRFLDQTYHNSAVKKLPFRLLGENQMSVPDESEASEINLKTAPRASPAKMPKGLGRDSARNSSPSSSSASSSPSTCHVEFFANIEEPENVETCSLFDAFASGEQTKIPLAFRPERAPGNDDSVADAVNQRSLSLPRSFLSLNYSNHREFLRWKHREEGNPEEGASDFLLNPSRSRTAPTTPTRDFRYGKSSESLNQIHFSGESYTSHFDASSFSNPRPAVQTFTQGKPERVPHVNSSEGNVSLIYKNPQQLTGSSSETVFQKLKKNFHLKYLKNKGPFKHSKESIHHNTGHESSENSCEAVSTACRRLSGLQSFEYDDHLSGKALKLAEEQNEWGQKRGQKNEKYDSHDSGIQMGNRGYLDSSESQDTDLQEDMDSPLMVRKRWIRDGQNFCQQDFANQTLSDRLKADFRWQNQIKTLRHGKGVRRTNSDVRGRKLFHSDFKNPDGSPLLASYSSPIIDENVWKTMWGLTSSGSTAVRNKFAGTKLRRSLSQPLGLNELPSFSRRSRTKCIALSEDEKNPRGKNPEDECLSDSESSVGSQQETKKSFDFASRGGAAMLAEAVWDHVAIESCELPFKAGEVVEVLDTQNCDWWWGATARNKGYFPSAFVRLRVNQDDTVEDCLAAMAKGKYISNRLRRGTSVSLLSNDQVRSSVVRELLNTEQDFVKVLRDVKDGYVEQCKRRTDMFTSAQINAIFSNLEDLLVFQEKFLNDLEASMDKEFPYKSCIGNVFLTHAAGFRMYSEYCNSHPMAIATLQDLYQRDDYCKFFETCRLKQSLIAIPLDGYLLTPIQRICKYPLQLAELLKYTKPEHPDYQEVEQALETMRGVATLINERKRKMESLEKLAAWQQRVEGWEGEDLIEISSRLIHQGDVARITSGVWSSNITLFLFDHQIVYCKKDLLKRNVYIYKGRISLDSSVVVDVPDGKNQQLGVNVKYGLQICSSLKDKWLLFCCRNSEDKTKWLEALAEEKRLVAQDREVDLDLTPTAKQLAKMAARTKEYPPCKPSGKYKFLFNHEEMPSRNCRPNASKTKTSRRVGTWFTLGGVIKNSKTNLRQRTSLHRVT